MKRCAIYTRKSTEEGLDQDFNSLDAQHEACTAFVTSQKHEGWRAVKDRFDDGGFSGGSMDRPALQRLLAEIAVGRIDVVVVYKVDRLTRSLSDFAKIVEAFDRKEVSFVSVTQAFNTTTSMGRLTLNMLLSFAQFEREVTAERIRDKVAASKKKGLWMGGLPPLGYDNRHKKLVVNEAEAETVRTLFALYRDLGSVREVLREADRRGIVTKTRKMRDGRTSGGIAFTRGNLYQLLANPLYAGRIPHRGKTYPGQHAAIIDDALWHTVQERLAGNAAPRRSATNAGQRSFLTGRIFDDTGDRLSPTHAVNRFGRRYRYFISRRLMHDADRNDGWRIAAPELERAVLWGLRSLLNDPRRLMTLVDEDTPDTDRMATLIDHAEVILAGGTNGDDALLREFAATTIARVDVGRNEIAITLDRRKLLRHVGVGDASTALSKTIEDRIAFPVQFKRRGVETKLVLAPQDASVRVPDPKLCDLIASAHRWHRLLTSGRARSVRQIAEIDDAVESEVSRLLPLAFLAPTIVEAILDGSQPASLTANALKRIGALPAEWQAQRRLLGFDG